MLYLSRIIQPDNPRYRKYGVVDSDDDTETLVTRAELVDIVLKHKLQVQGVVVINKKDGSKDIKVTSPQQIASQTTGRQTKTAVLLGVNVVVYNDEITAIHVNRKVMRDKQRIRLSDFAKKMNLRAKMYFTGPVSKRVVLVIDDKIELLGRLKDFSEVTGVLYDISEVEDLGTIGLFYSALMDCSLRIGYHFDSHVIDRKERMLYYQCTLAMHERGAFPQWLLDEVRSIPNTLDAIQLSQEAIVDIQRIIKGMHRLKWFYESAKSKASFVLCKFIKDHGVSELTIADYDIAINELRPIFRWLDDLDWHGSWNTEGLPLRTLRILDKYLAVCNPTDEAKELFIAFCNKAILITRKHDIAYDKALGCDFCSAYSSCVMRRKKRAVHK